MPPYKSIHEPHYSFFVPHIQLNNIVVEKGNCVTWNTDAGIPLASLVFNNYTTVITDDFGVWSTSGCRTIENDGGHTACECNQLGNFGILFVSIKCM